MVRHNEWAKKWAALACVVLALSCGGGGGGTPDAPAVEEYDGGELVALMRGARDAFEQNDFSRFQGLFGGRPEAKPAWDTIARRASRSSRFLIQRFLECPVLERAQPEIHVSRLVVAQWFDLSRETGHRGDVYQTTWKFERGDSTWTIANLRIDRAHTSYHDLLRDMQQLGYREYLTLDMDWEEAVDPLPLMRRWLEAAAADDYDALESRMVAGVYPRAFDMNIDLPTLASEEDWAGEANRESAEEAIESSISGLKESAGKLGLEAAELAPFFGVYRVTSMPENGTKLQLYAAFDGEAVPAENVTQFAVEWSASFINSRWLIEDMLVKSIQTTF